MEGSVYLKARQEWDERYADLVLGKRNWQITAAGMMAITLVLAFGMVWLSTRSKFVPYVVEVDKLGYAIGAPSALTENTSRISTDRMVRYELAAFIRNAREVITDPAAEHQLIGQVYSSRYADRLTSFSRTTTTRDDLDHDPFKVAQHQSVSVQIDSILPLSKATVAGAMDRGSIRPRRVSGRYDSLGSGARHHDHFRNLGLLDLGEPARLLCHADQLDRAAELGGDHDEAHRQLVSSRSR